MCVSVFGRERAVCGREGIGKAVGSTSTLLVHRVGHQGRGRGDLHSDGWVGGWVRRDEGQRGAGCRLGRS